MLNSIRRGRILLTAHEVVLTLEDGRTVGPWSGSIMLGQKIAVQSARPEQWAALSDLLTGRRRPGAGRLEEIEVVMAQSDTNIGETMDLNRSLGDFLNAPDTPEYVWLDQRRKVLAVLVDALGLRPDMTRPALKLTSPEIIEKVRALRFMVSQAPLLVGGDIFASNDEAIQQALARRWADIPGAVIAAEPEHHALPGAVDERWRIDEEGRFFVEAQMVVEGREKRGD